MIRVTGQLICRTMAEAEMVRTYLPDHIRLSRAEPGCLTFDVVPTDDPLIWRLSETFQDGAAFEAHQQRTRASLWFDRTRDLARDFHIEDIPA
ncbi:MAG: antibiotic biosynthesis monooxygenase [Tabrizicola sp.]|nr:antibiotic biosynthesis monooxygenase [Tabrizicola sp.]